MKIIWTVIICVLMSVLRVSVNFNGNTYDELGQLVFVTVGIVILIVIWWEDIKAKLKNQI